MIEAKNYKIEEKKSIFETDMDFIGWFYAKDLLNTHEIFMKNVRRSEKEFRSYFENKENPTENYGIIFNTGNDEYDTRNPQWAAIMLAFSHKCEDGKIKLVAGSLIPMLEYVDYVVCGNSIALPWMEDEIANWDKVVRIFNEYLSSAKKVTYYKNYK
jgi:hypothetical protein